MERRKIYKEAVSQAERLAAVHDPSGKIFNVGPVVVQEDGKVVSVELLERRAQAQAERAAKLAPGIDEATAQISGVANNNINNHSTVGTQYNINLERHDFVHIPNSNETKTKRLSKNQQKKLALIEERPQPPKPVIPNGIELPEGEENWVALWDLSDDGLERRVIREKKRKAAERKALREKQKKGKAERRAARDERRRVYREKKLEWKTIKGEVYLLHYLVQHVLIVAQRKRRCKRGNCIELSKRKRKELKLRSILLSDEEPWSSAPSLGSAWTTWKG
jgi:hypothetical protein